MTEHVTVKVHSEESYFIQEEMDQIKKLRQNSEKLATDAYKNEHELHCFRCGTPSLVEIERGDITVDVCINEGCGAIHLDPGELDQIVSNEAAVKKMRTQLFNIFKK
ncbi:zf-TFIIB domain-containing protein [Magnetofaba australis]|uniref:Transcription factor zinc-finger domain-containing protein n=1 Tax=Magnetofaba australis IT-1 TaxID=1434232 RepID=A0A1Y2K782_9PROT|nr:zf-TFIIB domain-containing protein [Magnetofaba australis]OSM06176.1 hypothetical protein MAIT1_01148 [Magnetofaba australis IT-1]